MSWLLSLFAIQIKRYKYLLQYHHHDQSSWYERTHHEVGQSAHRYEHRNSLSEPEGGLLANGRSDSHHSTPELN